MRPWTADGPDGRLAVRRASMGPRPCGRGRLFCLGVYAHGLTSFNGATALRPWTGSRRRCSPLRTSGFNGATALRPWTGGCAWSLAAWSGCFNGATALRPWTALGRIIPRLASAASMGPRPCGRGRERGAAFSEGGLAASMGPRPCGRGRLYTDYDAEGPTDELQWGHGLAAVDGTARDLTPMATAGFNGATALRPWTGGRD